MGGTVRGIDRWGPPLALGVALVGGTAAIVSLGLTWVSWRRGVGGYDFQFSDVVVGLLFPLAGASLVRRWPRNAAAWVMVSAGLVGVSALSHQWVMLATAGGSDLPFVAAATWLAAWTFAPFWLQPTLLPVLFPDGSAPSARWRRYVIGVVILVAAGTLAAAFRPDSNVEDLGLANPLGFGPGWALPGFMVVIVAAGAGAFVVGALVSLAGLVVRVRGSVGRERAQLQWLLFGFIAAAVCGLVAQTMPPLPVWSEDLLFGIGFAAIPATIAIAVVRHGLLDIEVVVNRTVVYVILTALGLGAYAGAVWLAGRWVAGGDAAPAVAAVVALVAAMARQRVQRFVDRRLFGSRSDPYAVVSRVSETVETIDAPAEALDALTRTVREALALPFVALEGCVEEAPSVSTGRPVADVEDLPVIVGGRQLAVMQVGHRHRGERFLPTEQAALREVAGRAAAILRTALLTADLQRGRERLVTASEEERRRVRRDLHDGLGPALAGMALQVDSLALRLQGNADLAERVRRLRDRLTETVSEVRRVVDGLRPTPVDELGLAEALRQLAPNDGASPHVVVDVPASFAPLPAAVETAAYRIVAEGMTNMLRHSRARRCVVRAVIDHGQLTLEVRDDGCGFPADGISGVGLSSMRERAAELGGVVAVCSQPGAGTVVRARIPLSIP